MKFKRYLFSFFTSLFIILSVSGQQNKFAGNYNFDVECLGSELDGTITLKVWGNGRNRFDAVAQAKKNAVYVVLFKGITGNQTQCIVKPLVPEVNAEEKYQTYFNSFFSDKTKTYLKFISLRDERIEKTIFRKRLTNTGGVTYGVIVRVLIPDLREELLKSKIIGQ